MADGDELNVEGDGGGLFVRVWENEGASFIALLVHGYGEHIGRYDHVGAALVDAGAVVYGPDHVGHGQSEGERVLIEDIDAIAADVELVAELAREQHPGVPLAVIGHSMGGLIAARYAQLYPGGLEALVLSAPAIGSNPAFETVANMDPMPEIALDPDDLSRDPEVGAAYAADPLVWHGPFKRTTLEALLAAGGAVAAGPAVSGTPVLWMHGAEDPIVPIDGTREAVEHLAPERRERIWEGARHEIFNETNSDEVLAEMTDFLGGAFSD